MDVQRADAARPFVAVASVHLDELKKNLFGRLNLELVRERRMCPARSNAGNPHNASLPNGDVDAEV